MIKITRITPYKNKNLRAFFSVSLGPLEITDMKLLLSNTEDFFLGFPSRSYESNGETKYNDIVRFTRNADGKFTEAAAKLYDDILNTAVAEYEKVAGSLTTAVIDEEESDDLPF